MFTKKILKQSLFSSEIVLLMSSKKSLIVVGGGWISPPKAATFSESQIYQRMVHATEDLMLVSRPRRVSVSQMRGVDRGVPEVFV